MVDNIGRLGNTQDTAHRVAIREVLATHSRGIDRNDPGILKMAYWPDAEVDYGGFKGAAHDFADLVGPALSGAYELTQHLLGQTFYSIEGSQAATESYVSARHLLHGAAEELSFAGRYLDQLELREGQWKIVHRQVVAHVGVEQAPALSAASDRDILDIAVRRSQDRRLTCQGPGRVHRVQHRIVATVVVHPEEIRLPRITCDPGRFAE